MAHLFNWIFLSLVFELESCENLSSPIYGEIQKIRRGSQTFKHHYMCEFLFFKCSFLSDLNCLNNLCIPTKICRTIQKSVCFFCLFTLYPAM